MIPTIYFHIAIMLGLLFFLITSTIQAERLYRRDKALFAFHQYRRDIHKYLDEHWEDMSDEEYQQIHETLDQIDDIIKNFDNYKKNGKYPKPRIPIKNISRGQIIYS